MSRADAAFAKVTWRLIPLLFICYVVNQVDRINIGYALLQMRPYLGFTDAVYGLGASMFYVGYFLFEVPSNLLLQRIGARKTILRIMLLWGLVSAGTAFVRTPTEFYIARFFLGMFEAGFLPGIVLYLTFWYPSERRARIVALFMTAVVVSGIVAGLLSGWILHNLNGFSGLQGWQWMFLIEGLPASILGIFVFFWMSDKPAEAHWLTADERNIVVDAVRDDKQHEAKDLRAQASALRDPRVYVLAFIYFTMGCGAYTLAFWTPSIIHSLGVADAQQIGFFAVIPYAVGAIAMVVYGRHSDKKKERRVHFAIAAMFGALALALTTLTVGNLWLSITLLSFATAGVVAVYPVFWAAATNALARSSAATGIATITTLGSISGVVCPYAIGVIKTSTGNLSLGLYMVAGVMTVGALVMLTGYAIRARRSPDNR
jgi:D-galactonate transporter